MFFIAVEGLDGSGKTTLVEALAKRFRFAKGAYPERRTEIGELIDRVLKNKIEIDPVALAHLFVANRWETVKFLKSTRPTVLDRYILSGQAYALSNGVELDLVTEMDRGLPLPNLTVFLDSPPKSCRVSTDEKFEGSEFQERVYESFKLLLKRLPQERVMMIPSETSVSKAIEMFSNWYEVFGASG